jgi:hypothetical protein
MERSLARLFLQQFEVTQSKVPLTPHCEFRRPNNLTKELKSIAEAFIGDASVPPPVGFVSFTFFSSHVMTEERRSKAVDLLVNFLPYVDGQVKSTKALMLSGMRKKQKNLIAMLPQASSSSCSISSSISNNDNIRTNYLEDVHGKLSNALKGMQDSNFNTVQESVHFPLVELENDSVKRQIVEGCQRVPLFRTNGTSKKGNKQEQCLIESSSNSVRVSFLFKQQAMASSDPLEASILYQWMRFFQQQAEDYKILRRKPLDGYSISFLILHDHLKQFGVKNTENWIMNFCAVLDKECSDIKIQVNAQARCVTTEYFKAF